ncbi:MAG: oligosaccharide flippase family protein [Patescibacteria group bacterium]
MKEFVLQMLQTKTIRHSVITFTGVFITGLLGFVFYFITARFLGPENFGIFSIAVITLTLVGDISDLGMTTGLVKFVGKYIFSKPKLAMRFMKLTLKIKLVVWLIVLGIGWSLVPFISNKFLGKEELIVPLRYCLIGVGGALLFSFVTFSLQAMQKFFSWSIINIAVNSLRLGVLGLLIYLGFFSLNSSLAVYIFLPFLGFVIGIFLLPNFFSVKNENRVVKKLFSFNIWVAVFTAIAAISSRLDIFLVTRLLTLEKVGFYSAAVNLSSVAPQIVFALATVVAPKLASFDSDVKAYEYLKKVQLFVLALSLAGLLVGIPISYFVIPALYGEVYTPSVTPLIILLIGQAIFLFSVPVHTGVIYYFGYPKLFVYVSFLHLAVIGLGGWILTNKFGISGTAITVLVGNILNFLIPGVWILRKFRK